MKAKVETDQNSVRATTTTIGQGNQDLRDIPQSVTVVTEKLIEDRRADTLKEALHYTAGISFQAAEGGEEDIRLRGFSLTASGDIYVDGMRDPAFYERDIFNFDRIELLRGSASMLFGRGSTGGVVNQVSKLPFLDERQRGQRHGRQPAATCALTGDFNLKTCETSALRLNVMTTTADNWRQRDRQARHRADLPLGHRHAPTSSRLGYYYLHNHNGINYGMPWLRADDSAPISATNPGGLIDRSTRRTTTARRATTTPATRPTARSTTPTASSDGGQLNTALRHGGYDRDQRASDDPLLRRARPADGRRHQPDCPTVAPTRSTLDDATPLDPRHQQQGPGPDDDLPADRLQQHLQLVRPQATRCSPASTWRARSSTTTR